MTGTLVDANPHGNHYHTSRRRPILAIVEHVTAGLEDLDATDDHSAESTARYAATTERQVSWHQGTDTDSTVVLLPDSFTAWHCRNYNSSTLGREISKRHTDWRVPPMPRIWVDRTLAQAAPRDAEWCVAHNIPVHKATKAELDAAIAHWDATGEARPVGFVGHWELDDARRSDPGQVGEVDTFPWHSYLELVAFHIHQLSTPATPAIPTEVPAIMAVTRLDDAIAIAQHCYEEADKPNRPEDVVRAQGIKILVAPDPLAAVNAHRAALDLPPWEIGE